MAFSSGFFNSKGLDRTYTAENFTDYLSGLICNGILDTYGDCFELTAPSKGLKVILGKGKAWLNGHYFINDAKYSIDLSEYQDESLPRYVTIGIVCDVSEGVRDVRIEVVAGTPAENPSVPFIPTDMNRTKLTLYAVRLNVGAKSLSEFDWFDYREDNNLCGYCRCILGKCRVTDMLAQLAELNAQIDKYNETIEGLNNKIDTLQLKINDMTGDIVKVGQCGDDIYYVLYSDGKLLLRGTGEMYDYGTSIPVSNCQYPDIDGDGRVTAADATLILTAAANIGAGRESGLTPKQEQLADVNHDGKINSVDASLVLSFSADIGAGKYSSDLEGWIEFLNNQREGNNLSPFFDKQNIKSVVVSNGITSIGTFAFNFCNSLKSVSMPNSLLKIGRNAFMPHIDDFLTHQNLYGLEELTIPDNVTEIGKFAFSGTPLKRLTVPKNITSVGEGIFSECQKLENVRYEGIVIGEKMFADCTALIEFTAAKSVKEIKSHAFNYCNKLKTLTYEGSLKDWEKIKKGYNWDANSTMQADGLRKIQCLDGYLEYDAETNEWKEVKEIA